MADSDRSRFASDNDGGGPSCQASNNVTVVTELTTDAVTAHNRMTTNSNSRNGINLSNTPRARYSNSNLKESRFGFYSEYEITSKYIGSYPSLKSHFFSLYSKLTSNKRDNDADVSLDTNTTTTKPSKTDTFVKFLNNHIPMTVWIPQYLRNWNQGWLRHDLITGFIVSILLIPQGMAYSTLAGFPSINGLYASSFPLFVFSVFSSSPITSVGPVASDSVMTAAAIHSAIPEAEEGTELWIEYGSMITLCAGVILLFLGIFRLASIIVIFLSRPVMQGFIFASALIVAINQIRTLFGLTNIKNSSYFYVTCQEIIKNLPKLNIYTLILSTCGLVILFGLRLNIVKKRVSKQILACAPLAIVIIGILLSNWFELNKKYDIQVVGNIPAGLPIPKIPNLSLFWVCLPYSSVVAIVGFIGAVALSASFEQKNMDRYRKFLQKRQAYLMEQRALGNIIQNHEKSDRKKNDNKNTDHSSKRKDRKNGHGTHHHNKHHHHHHQDAHDDHDITFFTDSEENDANGIHDSGIIKGASSLALLNRDDTTNNSNISDNNAGTKTHENAIAKRKGSPAKSKNRHITHTDKNKKIKENSKTKNDKKDKEKEKEKNEIGENMEQVNVYLDANKEMIAYGLSDLIGSTIGAQIISASNSRTALSFEMEGKTQLINVLTGLSCILVLTVFTSYLTPLPKCILSCIIMTAIQGLIRDGINEFIFLYKVSRMEMLEYLVALFLPLIIGLEYGIVVAIVVSLLVRLYRTTDATVIELGQIYGGTACIDEGGGIGHAGNGNAGSSDIGYTSNENENENKNEKESYTMPQIYYANIKHWKEAVTIPGIKIIELRAELSFTNHKILCDYIKNLLNKNPKLKYIVICLVHTQHTDSTSLRGIINIFEDIPNVIICLSHLRKPVRSLLLRLQCEGPGLPKNIKTFISTHDAVLYCQRHKKRLRRYKKRKLMEKINKQRNANQHETNNSNDDIVNVKIDNNDNNDDITDKNASSSAVSDVDIKVDNEEIGKESESNIKSGDKTAEETESQIITPHDANSIEMTPNDTMRGASTGSNSSGSVTNISNISNRSMEEVLDEFDEDEVDILNEKYDRVTELKQMNSNLSKHCHVRNRFYNIPNKNLPNPQRRMYVNGKMRHVAASSSSSSSSSSRAPSVSADSDGAFYYNYNKSNVSGYAQIESRESSIYSQSNIGIFGYDSDTVSNASMMSYNDGTVDAASLLKDQLPKTSKIIVDQNDDNDNQTNQSSSAGVANDDETTDN